MTPEFNSMVDRADHFMGGVPGDYIEATFPEDLKPEVVRLNAFGEKPPGTARPEPGQLVMSETDTHWMMYEITEVIPYTQPENSFFLTLMAVEAVPQPLGRSRPYKTQRPRLSPRRFVR